MYKYQIKGGIYGKVTLVLTLQIVLSYQFFGCNKQNSNEPPVANVQNFIDEYYGLKVEDPYR